MDTQRSWRTLYIFILNYPFYLVLLGLGFRMAKYSLISRLCFFVPSFFAVLPSYPSIPPFPIGSFGFSYRIPKSNSFGKLLGIEGLLSISFNPFTPTRLCSLTPILCAFQMPSKAHLCFYITLLVASYEVDSFSWSTFLLLYRLRCLTFFSSWRPLHSDRIPRELCILYLHALI